VNDIFVISDNIITSLGYTTCENILAVKNSKSGVAQVNNLNLFPEPFFASLISENELNNKVAHLIDIDKYTKFEKLIILSITQTLKDSGISASDDKTVFIYSSTKGNIDLLEENKQNKFEPERLFLWKSAEVINKYFSNKNKSIIISNACISGIMAIVKAHDILKTSNYQNAIVIGCDIVSEFVVSGFQSFKSLSPGICKPYDINRDGLNLGEGCGCIILSKNPLKDSDNQIVVKGGATSNDSNHISGPSRTGEGLFLAIENALSYSSLKPEDIDFISSHGTATSFNDEMESKAFTLAGLNDIPLNSLKAFFGHTLGAAGVIESIVSIHGMMQNIGFKTLGFNELGLPEKLNVLSENIDLQQNNIIKTASGFGGCNGAVIFSKHE